MTVTLEQPRKSPFVGGRSSSASYDPVDDSENLNPEEVHKSLRSTANAIQNYTFDSAVASADSAVTSGVGGGAGLSKPMMAFDSSSSASSLSKGGTEDSVDLPEGVKEATDLLDKQMAALNLGNKESASSTAAATAASPANGGGGGGSSDTVHKQNMENLVRGKK